MATKNKALKGPSGQRLQPIRATQPFQLRQGSPARKSPSLSPTAALSRTEVRRNKWSTSPDRGDRRSPSSPSVKVPTSHRTPSPRVWPLSQDTGAPSTIANTYLTGQWPREPKPILTSCSKSTQTNSSDWNNDSTKSSKSSTTRQSALDGDASEVKQMKQKMRRIAKNRHDKKDRLSPVHGNHAALSLQQPSQARQISSFRGPRRHNSVEGLNKEIENISFSTEETKSPFAPSDGRRAPLPRSATRSMETQTPNVEYTTENQHTPTPPLEQDQTHTNTQQKQASSDLGSSPHPKYSSSPRPNNSYMFKREPPEGAESIKPFKEMEISNQNLTCPDKQKVHYQPSNFTRFHHVKKGFSSVGELTEENNNTRTITNGMHRITLTSATESDFNNEIAMM